MLICQWHLEILYGKQADAVKALNAWGKEKMTSSEFRRAKSNRLLCGHVGPSASHIVDEYEFETLADFETALKGMAQPQFKPLSDNLASFVVPGSQHWEILRTLG
ncbi:MAG: hypothetical protein ABSH53_02695 [Holophaga sp.]|jgi:hypothetical protein